MKRKFGPERVKIILTDLYKDECSCVFASDNKQRRKKIETCSVCHDRSDMKWLLETVTCRTHFYFNNKIFSQVDGVSMGSLSGPLLADIYLVHLERELMNQLEQHGVVFWRRYVDDTLAILNTDADAEKLKGILNLFHRSIQFTLEPETDECISFLDINIRRLTSRGVTPAPQHQQQTNTRSPAESALIVSLQHLPSAQGQHQLTRSWFSTSIYRKPTFTGLILKWKSFVPLEYKRSAISSMIYRAIRITSDYFLPHKEFIFIRKIAVSNGYPLPFVLNIIRSTLDRHLETTRTKKTSSTNSQQSKNESKKRVILADIPFVGRPTISYGKKLVNIAKQVEPTFHIQPIYRTFPKVQSLFARKDPVPRQLLSNVVYNIPCVDCPAGYIGKTYRQVSRRLEEHGQVLPVPSYTSQSSQVPDIITTSTAAAGTEVLLCRSERKKQVINYATNEKVLDLAIKEIEPSTRIINSAIHDHQVETGHSIDWNDWKLLSKD